MIPFKPSSPKGEKEGYLEGQMLIAMPSMRDERFARSVIYLCAHSPEGAMGIILNRPASHIRFSELLVQLEIIPPHDAIQLPSHAAEISVLRGGPVETGRGFVLHSSDFFIENSTLTINQGICLTATLDILRAIAQGQGPASALLALGYAGWGAGQLESEIHANGWLNCPADFSLVFDHAPETKYERAIQRLGIDPHKLSNNFGHA